MNANRFIIKIRVKIKSVAYMIKLFTSAYLIRMVSSSSLQLISSALVQSSVIMLVPLSYVIKITSIQRVIASPSMKNLLSSASVYVPRLFTASSLRHHVRKESVHQYSSRDARKTVFEVFDQVRHKSVSAVTDDG